MCLLLFASHQSTARKPCQHCCLVSSSNLFDRNTDKVNLKTKYDATEPAGLVILSFNAKIILFT